MKEKRCFYYAQPSKKVSSSLCRNTITATTFLTSSLCPPAKHYSYYTDTCQGFVSVCLRVIRACWDSAQSCNIFHFHGCFDKTGTLPLVLRSAWTVLESFSNLWCGRCIGTEADRDGAWAQTRTWKMLIWGTFSFITDNSRSSLWCLPRIMVLCASAQDQGAGGVHCSLHSCNLSAAVTRDAGKQVPITGISWCHQMMCSD